MSCVPDKTTYRLLDRFVGWFDVPPTTGLAGFGSSAGLRLAQTGAMDCNTWRRWFSPPRLAWNCSRCEWILATPDPSQFLRMGPCECAWQPVWARGCQPTRLRTLEAVAANSERFAAADRGAGLVYHFAARGARFLGTTNVDSPVLLAYGGDQRLIVCSGNESGNDQVRVSVVDRRQLRVIRRYSADLPAGSHLLGMRARGGEVWIVHEAKPGDTRLTRVDLDTGMAGDSDLNEVRRRLSPLPLAAVSGDGFCLARGKDSDSPCVSCFSWYGRPIDASVVTSGAETCAERYIRSGELVTDTLDSGIVDCIWHRVTLDAVVPSNSTLKVYCTTSAAPDADPATLEWWTPAVDGATDFLIMRPPGRYLRVRVAFQGDGYETPSLRRARFEFPRATSLEHLPPVYREGGRIGDFTERFLALFDSVLSDLDSAIERLPALFDLRHTPEEALPWLGTWLDVAYDPRWSPSVRRRVLRAIPFLYAHRGTRQGMRGPIQLVLGQQVELQELGPERAFAAIGRRARLGGVRLFGRSASRVRLGMSPLGGAPIRSFGNPDRDALAANAFRFRVLAGGATDCSSQAVQKLADLVASQKPAHTVEVLRTRGAAWLVGCSSAVGVDTAFAPLPAPVLGGSGGVRLGRSVISAGERPPGRAIVAGAGVGVGINTYLE